MNRKKILNADIVVVGSGIGGLVAAKKATDQGLEVLLITSSKMCGGASYFPLKGTLGIQATSGEFYEKDKLLFTEDISRVGLGMDNPHMVKEYIENIQESIGFLNEIGFTPWLRADKRPACFAKHPRDIYLIKDWEEARKQAQIIFSSIPNLKIEEEFKIIKILKENNCISGAIFKKNNEELLLVNTKAIILATGGIAGLYENNLYPEDVDGIGHIVALDAGAKVTNMEFIQFIPAFITPKYNTLYGEHTAKYVTGMYDLFGKLIYPGVENSDTKKMWEERSEYAPFSCDFKSSEIDLTMIESINNSNKGVELKFSKDLYKDSGEFYVVYLKWLKETMGIDMCRDKIVLAPFAHGCNGGILVSDSGETCVNGLYAIGELSSSVEGANRLGGNSVGGALVFGNRAVLKAKKYIEKLDIQKFDTDKNLKEFEKWLDEILPFQTQVNEIKSRDKIILELKKIMGAHGGIKRDAKNLEDGILKLENLKQYFNYDKETKFDYIDIYLKIEVAKLLLKSMLERNESRGAHYREDYPERDENIYRVVISMKNNNLIIDKIRV